jgi:hypothetical protein
LGIFGGFSWGICLIFVGWGGNFEFSRGLHHVGLFLGNGGEIANLDNVWFENEKEK